MARGRKLIIGAAALAVLSAGTVVGGDLLGVVEPRSWVPTSIASAADDSGSSGSVADPVESPATPSAPPADRGVGEPEAPTLVLAPGAEGMKVRALQVRLAQLAWYLRQPTGTYDRPT